MWQYEKKLQYPINIKNPNPKYAQIIISQYGGPDGELGASMRYLTQRYSMPYDDVKAILTDIGIEEKYCAFRKKIQSIEKGPSKGSFYSADKMLFNRNPVISCTTNEVKHIFRCGTCKDNIGHIGIRKTTITSIVCSIITIVDSICVYRNSSFKT